MEMASGCPYGPPTQARWAEARGRCRIEDCFAEPVNVLRLAELAES
jgi:hypothetical protein